MTKTGKMRLIIWIVIIILAGLVVMWEFQKDQTPETMEQPEVVEEVLETEPESSVPLEEVTEEPAEPVMLLLPEVAAEQTQSGETTGTLIIPAIDLNMPVIADATPRNLNRAPALMKSTHMPGSPGNAVISGHRMYEFGSHFNRLDEIKIGDQIDYVSHEATYHFEVEQITVVDPAEIWITLGDNREARLTLFACTPIRIATHRLVVFAVLREVVPL
jgi:sortase A